MADDNTNLAGSDAAQNLGAEGVTAAGPAADAAAAAGTTQPTADAPVAAAVTTDLGASSDEVGTSAPTAPAGFLQALEKATRDAESAMEHEAHALLNDLHLLATQVKARAAAASAKLTGEAAELAAYLHRVL